MTGTPPVVTIEKSDAIRLVPTAYFKPPVLRALAADEARLSLLEKLEQMTSRRARAESQGLSDLDPRELLFKAWGRTFVNAAFAYTRPEGNRFNGADRGAWYCAFEDLTALDEVAFHRTRELARVGVYEDEAVYQSLLAGFMGDFHDLRGALDHPALNPDPARGYPAGQALARALRAEGARGIVYPSARRKGGVCLVAFQPALVQNVRPGARWRLRWNGSPGYEAAVL